MTLAPETPPPVLTVDALGVPVRLLATEPLPDETVAAIARAWRDCTVTAASDATPVDLEMDRVMFDDLERGLSDLSTRVTLAAIEQLRGSRLMLHAAGVADDAGRVLALVGPSGRGKTTASRHLGTRFGYVSDETVSIDDDLSVRSYRKPLSVIVQGKDAKEQIAPSDVGLRALPSAPLRLFGISLLERRPDTDASAEVEVDLIDAICEMVPQISYLPELASPLQSLARTIEAVGGVTRLVYRDAVDLPDLVTSVFAAPRRVAQEWSPVGAAVRTGPWRSVEVDDAIVVDGRAAVLVDGTVSALDHRGCLVWALARSGATTAEITTAAVEAFGDPGDDSAGALIAQTLTDLQAAGLLETA